MKEIYCWACDISHNTGEGNLANLFIKKNINGYPIIYSPNFINFNNLLLKKIINYKYFSPIFGILFCWYFFFKKKRIAYINYLPLWNFIIFALIPPTTLLGPITGGAYFEKKTI